MQVLAPLILMHIAFEFKCTGKEEIDNTFFKTIGTILTVIEGILIPIPNM